jgi:uncharacterized SAM-dependent methyltransferase
MPHPTSEDICLLPEYYLTRAESEIFARRSDERFGSNLFVAGGD